jgi:hypothetical protein
MQAAYRRRWFAISPVAGAAKMQIGLSVRNSMQTGGVGFWCLSHISQSTHLFVDQLIKEVILFSPELNNRLVS